MDYSARRTEFRRLHESGCSIIPNPWDVGTARYLRGLGFRALATTSGGFAFSRGLPDAEWAVSRDMMLGHIAEIVASVELPVNADFESGYAAAPEEVSDNVRRCVETGVAGLSIEDRSPEPDEPLFELGLATERIRAARSAIDATGTGVMLTGRAECYLVGHPDPLRESIRRLQAYSEAGADVLYAPGPSKPDDVRAIVDAVAPKPVNLLMSANTGLKVADVAALGVRRISLGSSLARAAWTGFIRAATLMAHDGSFGGLEDMASYAALNEFFERDRNS